MRVAIPGSQRTNCIQPIPEAEERGHDVASVCHRTEPDPPTSLTSEDCSVNGS